MQGDQGVANTPPRSSPAQDEQALARWPNFTSPESLSSCTAGIHRWSSDAPTPIQASNQAVEAPREWSADVLSATIRKRFREANLTKAAVPATAKKRRKPNKSGQEARSSSSRRTTATATPVKPKEQADSKGYASFTPSQLSALSVMGQEEDSTRAPPVPGARRQKNGKVSKWWKAALMTATTGHAPADQQATRRASLMCALAVLRAQKILLERMGVPLPPQLEPGAVTQIASRLNNNSTLRDVKAAFVEAQLALPEHLANSCIRPHGEGA